MLTEPSLFFLFASKIISLSSSSVMFSPSSFAMYYRSSNVMLSFSCENKINAFSSSFSPSRSDIFVVIMSRKSLKSIFIWPSLSLSPSRCYAGLFNSLIRRLISALAGSKPRALSATFRSCKSIMPLPFVSNKSNASLISAFYSSFNS